MLLASVDQIRKDLGFDKDMGDIVSAIESGLHTAEPQLSSYLTSDFERREHQDLFFTDGPGDNRVTQFRLSNGFAAVESIRCTRWNETVDYTATARITAEVGLVQIFEEHFGQERVEIRYTAGFPVDPANEESYDLTFVPKWLQTAASLRCKILLADSAAIKGAEIEIDTKLLETNFQAAVARKIRYLPLALIPV